MNYLSHYLDELKLRRGFKTDVELATFLGMQRQDLRRARKEGYLTDHRCFIVAEEIGVSPARVLAARELLKAKTPEVRAAWRDLMSKAGMFLLAAGLALTLSMPAAGDNISMQSSLLVVKITGIFLSFSFAARFTRVPLAYFQ